MFTKSWKSSKQPRKQRKYRYNAPDHTKGRLLHSNLSKALREKHKKRSIRVRTGDKVKVVRGQFKGTEAKVERVDMTHLKVYIEKVEIIKKDGSKAFYPVDPSNIMITELTEDKKRLGEKK